MGLFSSFKKTAETIKKREEKIELPEGYDKNDDIWKLRTINDIIVAMCNRLTRKSNYGENMEMLSEEERIFYIATEIDSQASSVGFDHFFYDEAGRFAMEVPEVLRTLGADKRAALTEKAIEVMGGDLPVDNKERAVLVRNNLTDDVKTKLADLQKEYLEIEDDFNRLLFKYLSEHHFKFTE